MPLTTRTVGVVAVSTLLAILGLVWFQRRKKSKPPSAKKLDFTDEKLNSTSMNKMDGDSVLQHNITPIESSYHGGLQSDRVPVSNSNLIEPNSDGVVTVNLHNQDKVILDEVNPSMDNLKIDDDNLVKEDLNNTAKEDQVKENDCATDNPINDGSVIEEVVCNTQIDSPHAQRALEAIADNENNENSCNQSELSAGDNPNNCQCPKVDVSPGKGMQGADSPVNCLVSSNSSSSDNSEVSCDSGKGVSISPIDEPPDDMTVYEFEFPSDMCGLFIGRHGKNIIHMKEKSGASIALSELRYTPDYQKCSIKGSQSAVDKALGLISSRFPDVDTSVMVKRPASLSNSLVIPSDTMQLHLPEGVSVDVITSSIVSGGHIFVQQLTHPSFTSLDRLNQCMCGCYNQDTIVPQLPRPVDVGVICAAPMMSGWYRAQVVSFYDDTDECDIKYVDYGGYARIPACQLKQIRSDFVTLPFQAAEGYLANVTHLADEKVFSQESAAMLEELTQGVVLQCQISGYAEDNIPYLQLYCVQGSQTTFLNRELVNRGMVRWIENQ